MPEFPINYLAVLVAGLINMPLGMLWYSTLFGKQFMALVGMKKDAVMTPEMKKQINKSYATTFVCSLLMAYVLAVIIVMFGATTLTAGLIGGFWCWLGFIVTTNIGTVLWENRPFKLYLINMGYYLVSMLIMGGILAVWR
jgi:hypothetical protein